MTDGGDGRGGSMSAAVASEDSDFEASIEELVEDGWTKIASGLSVSPGLALDGKCSYPGQSDFSDASR